MKEPPPGVGPAGERSAADEPDAAHGEAAVAALGLTKIYGRRVGCLEVDLEIGRGEIFGLLGPNGAGKSTLVRLLLGLLRPTAGQARLLGRAPGPSALGRVGYLPELFRYPEWATAAEVLGFHGALLGLDRASRAGEATRALSRVGLAGAGRLRVGAMSKGMQQRLGLAVALLGDPEVVFLDEPTSALDPVGRREVRQLLAELRREGRTVFLNSHLLTEVEMVCDRVAVMRAGRVAAAGRLEELLPPAGEVRVRLGAGSPPPDEVTAAAAQAGWRVAASPPSGETAGAWRLLPGAAGSAPPPVPALVAALVAVGARVHEVQPVRRTLEDLFVELVGGGPPDATSGATGATPGTRGGARAGADAFRAGGGVSA